MVYKGVAGERHEKKSLKKPALLFFFTRSEDKVICMGRDEVYPGRRKAHRQASPQDAGQKAYSPLWECPLR